MKNILFILLIVNFIGVVQADNTLENEKLKQELSEFAGLKFGVGVSLTLDTGDNKRVKDAIIDPNGIVRIKTEQSDVARVMLESHYFFSRTSEQKVLGVFQANGVWGHGPFVALQPGTDEIIEAVGLGWMIGLKRKGNGDDSWNIGLGYVVDPTVQILGDGIVENQPIPTGESNIRFKETSQGGVFFLVSFGF